MTLEERKKAALAKAKAQAKAKAKALADKAKAKAKTLAKAEKDKAKAQAKKVSDREKANEKKVLLKEKAKAKRALEPRKSPTKVRYTFKGKLGGISYETKVTPKMWAKLTKDTKDFEANKERLRILKNALAESDGDNKAILEKEAGKLRKANAILLNRSRKTIKARSHSASTPRGKNGKNGTVTLIEKKRRINQKMLQGETYIILFRLTEDVTIDSDQDTKGAYLTIVDSPEGLKTPEEMIHRAYRTLSPDQYVIISIKTETYKRT